MNVVYFLFIVHLDKQVKCCNFSVQGSLLDRGALEVKLAPCSSSTMMHVMM